MFEVLYQVPDGACELRVDRVARTAGWRGVMRFVEDQHPLPTFGRQPVAQRRGIFLVTNQVMRHDEPRVCRPRVNAEAALLAHAADVLAVEHREREPEALFQFVLPLQHHRWRRGHDYAPDALAHEEFADDEPRLNRLAQAHVVGDEQVHARQQQRLAQRFQLVGVHADAGSIWRLKQLGIR